MADGRRVDEELEKLQKALEALHTNVEKWGATTDQLAQKGRELEAARQDVSTASANLREDAKRLVSAAEASAGEMRVGAEAAVLAARNAAMAADAMRDRMDKALAEVALAADTMRDRVEKALAEVALAADTMRDRVEKALAKVARAQVWIIVTVVLGAVGLAMVMVVMLRRPS